jgi:hypothetical protein
MLGHASAAMTLDVYSGAFDEHLTALAEQMDAAARAAAEARVGAVWAQPPTEQAHESNRAGQPGGPRGDRTHNPRIKRTNELSAVLTCIDALPGRAYEAQSVAVQTYGRRTSGGTSMS